MKSEGKRIYVKALIITLISLMCSVRAWSQAGVIYPVDINVTLTPPYGTCLTDLTNSDRFRIQALMRDMSHPEYEMVIQMMIRDLSSLSPVFISTTNAFSLTAGEPTKIIGRDVSFASIADFFNFQNIRVGVQYVGTKCLPEGAYLFSFQAFDAKSYRTNRIPISREVTFSAFLEGGEVPILTYPAQNDSICDVQSIHFTWMQPFVSSGVNTYRLQILKSNTDFPLPAKELLDNPNTNDRIEVTTLIPSYTFHDTYNFLEEKTNFLEEKTTYYWRVVLCDADGNARLSYPNKGASEVRSFVYCGEKKTPEPDPDADWVQKKPQVKSIKDNLDVVKLIKAEEDGPDVVRAFCKKDEQEIREKYSGIIVEVKKKSHDTWTPFNIESQSVEDTSVSLGNLAYNELYEARAQYYIDEGESTTYAPYSETIEFTISNPADTIECGSPLPELNSDCAEAPKELKEGDKFSANGANVTVLEITSQSVEGNKLKISGTGYVNFPILRNFKLKVKFENAVLNCNLQLEDGTVESVYDLSTAATIDLNNLLGKGAGGYDLPETDPSIVDIPGIDPDNCEECKSYESGTLFSSGGEVYMKDENGAVVSVGKEIDLSTSGEYESNEIRKDNILVWFSNPDPANIAFDNDSMGYYRSIASINDQYTLFATNYITPWVANNPGRVVTLKAKPSDDFKKSGYTEPKFVLKTSATSYVELNNQPNGDGTYSVSIPGTDPSNITHIYVIARPSQGQPYENVGQLKVACYEKKTQKVILVPVANVEPNAETVKSYLTSVYGKLGYSFDVEVDNDKSHVEGINSDQISITSGVFTQYSDEMNSVINTYTGHLGDSYDKSAAYLFLMNKASGDNSSVGGIMPQKHQFGFIFTGGTDVDNRTIAHELGHGLWGLDHTFVKAYKIPEGTTPHLMDYNNGIYLAHFEWSQIDKPVLSWSLMNSDKDNEAFNLDGTIIYTFCDQSVSEYLCNKYKYFFDPDGSKIDLSKIGAAPFSFYAKNDVTQTARGSVSKFKCDGVSYQMIYDLQTTTVLGYGKDKSSGIKYKKADILADYNKIAYRIYIDYETGFLSVYDEDGHFKEMIKVNLCKNPDENNYKEKYFSDKKIEDFTYHQKSDIKFCDMDITDYINEIRGWNDKDNKERNYGFLPDVIQDKLRAYEKFNERKFVIVKLESSIYTTNQEEWNCLAKRIFEESKKKGYLTEKDILITIPNLKLSNITNNYEIPYYMPGLCYGKDVFINTSTLKGFNNLTDSGVEEFILGVFTQTSKKAVIYRGILQPTLATKCDSVTFDAVSGYDFNCTIDLLIYNKSLLDNFIEYIDDLGKQMIFNNVLGNMSEPNYVYGSSGGPSQIDNVLLWKEYRGEKKKFFELLKKLEDDDMTISRYKKRTIELKEEYMCELCSSTGYSNAVQFITYNAFEEYVNKINGSPKKNFSYNQNHVFTNKSDYMFKEFDEAIYSICDMSGICLGFVGLDWVSDILGGAYAVMRNDYYMAATYGASFFVIGPGGTLVKKGMNKCKYVKLEKQINNSGINGNVPDFILVGYENFDKLNRSNVVKDALKALNEKKITQKTYDAITYISKNSSPEEFDLFARSLYSSNKKAAIDEIYKSMSGNNRFIDGILDESMSRMFQSHSSGVEFGDLDTWADVLQAGFQNYKNHSNKVLFGLECVSGADVSSIISNILEGKASEINVTEQLLDCLANSLVTFANKYTAKGAKAYFTEKEIKEMTKKIDNTVFRLKSKEKGYLFTKIKDLCNDDETDLFTQWKMSIENQDLLSKINKYDKSSLVTTCLEQDITDINDYVEDLKDALNEYPSIIDEIYVMGYDRFDYLYELSKTSEKYEKLTKNKFFKVNIEKGRKFEQLCVDRFANKKSSEYIKLKNKFDADFNKNLDEYELFSQVQLFYCYGDNYFIADHLFVKFEGDEIVDFVIIEDKLKNSTSFTKNQGEAFKCVSFTVRNDSKKSVGGFELKSHDNLYFNGSKQIYKVYDSDEGDAISDIVLIDD